MFYTLSSIWRALFYKKYLLCCFNSNAICCTCGFCFVTGHICKHFFFSKHYFFQQKCPCICRCFHLNKCVLSISNNKSMDKTESTKIDFKIRLLTYFMCSEKKALKWVSNESHYNSNVTRKVKIVSITLLTIYFILSVGVLCIWVSRTRKYI